MTKDPMLLLHSIIGGLVFITGILQILLKKGGATHKIVGQFYIYSWILLLLTGANLGGLIISIIGIFGFYFAFTGSLIARLKNEPVRFVEKSVFTAGGIIALAMLYYSVSLFVKGENSFSIILGVFGGIFLFTTVKDIFKYVLDKPLGKQLYGKLDWYFEHVKRMSISFIAAITALTSIQNVFNNNTVNFLAPTLVGTVLIKLAIDSYKKKLLN